MAGPTTPSTVRPWRACRRLTAASVSGPKVPSVLSFSLLCRRDTASPPEVAFFASRGDSPVSATVAAGGVSDGSTAEAGGVSVSSPLTPSTLHVAGPTTPSTVRPWRACELGTWDRPTPLRPYAPTPLALRPHAHRPQGEAPSEPGLTTPIHPTGPPPSLPFSLQPASSCFILFYYINYNNY